MHELRFNGVDNSLVGAAEKCVVNVYDADDDVGAFLLVEEYACFGLKVLKTKLL